MVPDEGDRALLLETPRMLLAALRPGDQADVYRLYASPEVARELARLPAPWTREEAAALIRAAQEGLAEGHAYMLGMFLRETGAFLGVAALRVPERDPSLDERGRADDAGLGILGYSVLPERWGRGYAGEGAGRLVRFALDELGLRVLQASPRRTNLASARVLQRLGFTLAEAGIEEQALAGGPPHLIDRYLLVRERAS